MIFCSFDKCLLVVKFRPKLEYYRLNEIARISILKPLKSYRNDKCPFCFWYKGKSGKKRAKLIKIFHKIVQNLWQYQEKWLVLSHKNFGSPLSI